MERYSGRKGSWVPDYYDEIWSRRDQWQWDMRQRVLDTAAALLDEVGPRRFTVKEVARRAGYARTTVYKYFRHKAGLLAACREHVARREAGPLGLRAWAIAEGLPDRKGGGSGNQPGGSPGGQPEGGQDGGRDGGVRLPRPLRTVWRVLTGLAAEMQGKEDLWLLAAAEGVRSKRRPARLGSWALPSPVPSPVLSLVYKYLLQAQRAGAVPEEADLQELAHMLCGLWWYGLCVRGPYGETDAPDSLRWLPAALAWVLCGVRAAAGKRVRVRPEAGAAEAG